MFFGEDFQRGEILIYFATSNKHKFKEAKEILAKKGISVKHFQFKHNEIRSDSIEDVALESVETAYKKLKKPVFVEDTGLFVKALDGFPGTYSGWVFGKMGAEGILKLMNSEKNRNAEFKTCIAFTNGKIVKTFIGTVKGTISKRMKGKGGFGYDPVFIPRGERKTFAESIVLKNKLSHRYNSLLKFSKYINAYQ